jgi:hypothetical protein
MIFADCGVTDPHELRRKGARKFRFEAVELGFDTREYRERLATFT